MAMGTPLKGNTIYFTLINKQKYYNILGAFWHECVLYRDSIEYRDREMEGMG